MFIACCCWALLLRLHEPLVKEERMEQAVMGKREALVTKGGPNGKRVDGILYKHWKGEEVRIMVKQLFSFAKFAMFNLLLLMSHWTDFVMPLFGLHVSCSHGKKHADGYFFVFVLLFLYSLSALQRIASVNNRVKT
ncbi:hypothetical protein PVK06_008130 [Gossypium arboreum]|uniref:Uncharacterized protein n=1 Tax=Gossypium arboreum TaxID=29729 RepID=A0ABR0QJ72_GOSAR|nr:hypothetical protein PVK06_008130 [Gossypium arboreum]